MSPEHLFFLFLRFGARGYHRGQRARASSEKTCRPAISDGRTDSGG